MSEANKVLNPFQQHKPPANATAESSQAREVQEVQAAMIIAKKFPRNQIEAMDKILQAFTRPSLAEGALYSFARGGSDITGPSIRSAETIAQLWGNIQFGIREIEQRPGESTVEAFAWDVETNTRQVKVFQVQHVRHTRQGSKRLEDPRDIYEMVANQGARRLRACILGIIPGDVTEQAVRQAELTLKANADTSDEAIAKMVDAFDEFGVTKTMIETRIQRRLSSITPALMVQMKKIYASLRDGMSTAGEWFDMPVDSSANNSTDGAKSGASAVKEKIRERQQGATTANQAAQEPTTADDGVVEQETQTQAEIAPESDSGQHATYAEIADMINTAADIDQINESLDLIRSLKDKKQQAELRNLAGSRKAAIMNEQADA